MSKRQVKHNLYRIRKCPNCGQLDRILRCGLCFECYKNRIQQTRYENMKRGEKSLLKLPTNKPERQFIESAEEKGWSVIRKGWPDYLCFKLDADGKISELMAVEVKPTHQEGLKLHQLINCILLSRKGIDCYLYGAQEKTLRKIEGEIPPTLFGK